jgi:phosphomannomutase
MDIDALLKVVESKYSHQPYSTIDGLKIEFGKQWVHLRRSNTEPVIRIYSEANSMENADKLAYQIMADINALLAF